MRTIVIVVLSVVICMVAAAVLTFMWWTTVPLYKAEALVGVQLAGTWLWSDRPPAFHGKEIMERYKRSQAALVKREEIRRGGVKPAAVVAGRLP